MNSSGQLTKPLSRREHDILILLGLNMTDRKIANQLLLSINSVKWYTRQVYGKLGVANRQEAVVRARQLGLLSGEQSPTQKSAHKLPRPISSFIGREKEIIQVLKMICEHPLVTLTGAGGVGKTRLALQVAGKAIDAFPDGVWMVDLASLSDPERIPEACLLALGMRQEPFLPAASFLEGYLEEKRLLLLLDNCEHVITACTRLVDALLKGCPHLHILATSREMLDVPGEHLFRVPSLTVPEVRQAPSPLAELVQSEAARLFVERAAQVAPDFELRPENVQAVAQVCQRLDGIPLAIELAAGRMRVLSVTQVAARLDNAFRLLTEGSRAVLPRHQTLKAAIDWSYDLLFPKERLLLQRLSVFAGGWTLESAEAICADDEDGDGDPIALDDVLDLLEQLVDKSLVSVQPGESENHYRMLEIIRQYGRDRLLEAGGSRKVRDRHLDTFAALTRQAELHLRGKGMLEWLSSLKEELGNLRAAMEWALVGPVEEGLQMAADLMWFWHNRSLFVEGTAWCERLLAAEKARRGDDPLTGNRALQRARVLRSFAYLAYHTNYLTLEEKIITVQRIKDSSCPG